jgi:hypothetical protein
MLGSAGSLLLDVSMSSVVKLWPSSAVEARGLSSAPRASLPLLFWSPENDELPAAWRSALKLPLLATKVKSSSEALKLVRSCACLLRLVPATCEGSRSEDRQRQGKSTQSESDTCQNRSDHTGSGTLQL